MGVSCFIAHQCGCFSTGSLACEIAGSHVIRVVTQHVQLDVFIPVAQQQEQLPGRSSQPGHVQSLWQVLASQPEICFGRHQFPLHEVACAAVLKPRQSHGGGPAGALQFLLSQLAADQEGGRFD